MGMASKFFHVGVAAAGIPAAQTIVQSKMASGDPVTWVDRLATGSAQFVLSAVVVVEAFALYKLFTQWRKDVDAGQEKLEGLIEKNTEALTGNKASNEQLCHTIERFERVVERCEHNNNV